MIGTQNEKLPSTLKDVSRIDKYAALVSDVINRLEIGTVLEYGCGIDPLANHLMLEQGASVSFYDKNIVKYSDKPFAKEMVVCINVLHGDMDGDEAVNVLNDLQALTKSIALIAVKSGKYTTRWWTYEVCKRFELHAFTNEGEEFWYMVKVD